MSTVESVTKHLSLGRAIAALLLGAMAFGASMAMSRDRLAGAVQRTEFTDTVRAIRRDLNSASSRAEAAAKQSTSVSCYLAKYPVGLCDEFVPKGEQAGRPR